MKIDVTKQIFSLKGMPLKVSENENMTLRYVFCVALLESDEQKTSGEDKYRKYKLFNKIDKCENEVDLDRKEIDELKQVVGKVFRTEIMGQVWDLLNPSES